MGLIAANLSPAALLRLAEENSEWEIDQDLEMAKRFMAAIQRAMLLSPEEIQQGGVGRGSGFSSVMNVSAWEKMLERVRNFVVANSAGNAAALKHFGLFAGDLREVCNPLESA